MKTVATLPTAKAIPNTSRFLAFFNTLRSVVFSSPLLDSILHSASSKARQGCSEKPGGSKVAPFATARRHGILRSTHMARSARCRWRSFFFFDRTVPASAAVLRLQPKASYYSSRVVLGLYLFDEVMPKSVEGEMAAKRADAIAADFVNTGTSRVRV